MENKKDKKLIEKELYFFKSISLVDKYNFYEYLAVMLDSGVGIVEAIHSFIDKSKSPYFKQKVLELATFVSSGDSFSKAMKKIPTVFSQSESSIVEAGESSGILVLSLQKLSDDYKKLHNLRLKIKTAFTYPIIIFLFLILAIFIVLLYVIPSIVPLFETTNVELPWATLALIGTSNFIKNNFLGIILFILFMLTLLAGYRTTKTGNEAFDNFILSLPLVGKVYKNYILSSAASLLGTLIGSGIPIVKTLTLIGKTTNNSIYENLFSFISLKVSSGKKIVDSMREVDEYFEYFPSDFTQMLSVGEKTANLESISKKISDQYTKEVDYSLANLTRWIEPIAILIAGIFVLWFAFAIFGAILKLTQTVG